MYTIDEFADIVQAEDYPLGRRFPSLCSEALKLTGPLAPCWQALALRALGAWGEEPQCRAVFVMGNAILSARDIAECRHDIAFIFRLRNVSGFDDVWVQPRFAGVLFAVAALSPVALEHSAAKKGEVERHVRRCTFMQGVLTNDEEEGIACHGLYNQDWCVVQRLGCRWLRVIGAARTLQRAWRAKRKQQRTLAWMPQHVLVPDDECAVCYGKLVSKPCVVCPACGNALHDDCARRWLTHAVHKNCVYCRSDVWNGFPL